MGTRIDMIGIFADDLANMVAFYRDVPGFEIEWDGHGPYAGFKNEGVRFSMYERSEPGSLLTTEPGFPSGINGTFELALDHPHSDDVDRKFKELIASGARRVYEPRDEPWGMRSSMITGPEGNLIELGSWNRG
jgi:lactoylglutathione lyase